MSILGLLGLAALAAGDSIRTNANIKKRAYEATKYRQASLDEHMIFMQDIRRDWNGGKTMFPEGYIRYLTVNCVALEHYIKCLVSKKEADSGLKPMFYFGQFNKSTHKPFEGFEDRYAKKIKEYNETGVLYY